MPGHDTGPTHTIRLLNGQTLEVDAKTADWHGRLVAVCNEIIETRRAARAAWLELVDCLEKAIDESPSH